MNEVSKIIKKTRTDKNITLKNLSEKTDLSISFLSQVERGVSSLTITSLKKIADALEVSLKDLVSYEENTNYVHKKDNHVILRLLNDYSSHQVVSGKFDGRKLEGIILKVAPGRDMDTSVHPGEELHYVIQGTPIFYIDEKKYVLDVGEIIHFPSTLKHKIKNIGTDDVVILSVLTPTIF